MLLHLLPENVVCLIAVKSGRLLVLSQTCKVISEILTAGQVPIAICFVDYAPWPEVCTRVQKFNAQFKLVELGLSGIPREEGDKNGGMEVLAHVLSKCTALKYLRLSCNKWNDKDIKLLANALLDGKCQSVVEIDLACNCISKQGAMYLAEAFRNRQHGALTGLDLYSNKIGADGVFFFGEFLKSEMCKRVTDLNFANNGIGPKGAKHFAEALKEGACKSLTSLDLSGNEIGPEGAKSVADMLHAGMCPVLTKLRLGGNGLGNNGMKYIAGVLRHLQCPSLTLLDLDRNGMDVVGLQTLITGLRCCSVLTDLDLGQNNIGPEGAAAIATLEPITRLVYLRLMSNSIGTVGAQKLAQVLPQCTALQQLDIRDNDICDKGHEDIVDAAPSNLVNINGR